MSEPEIEQMDRVDKDPRVHEVTEPDEEVVLKTIYGETDDGVYR